MKVYRYEKPDGGGPWFTKEGTIREEDARQPPVDEYLNGCDSLESLQDYFSRYPSLIKDCELKVYDVPDNEVIRMRTHTVLFPKKFREE